MTITLGGITLPDDMYLEGPFQWTGVGGSVDRSLGGNLIIWEGEVNYGEILNLIAEHDSGWIDYTTVGQIRALAMVPKATYELDYRGQVYTVRFRHEDAPALDLVPLITRIEFETDSYYYGQIKLMVVG